MTGVLPSKLHRALRWILSGIDTTQLLCMVDNIFQSPVSKPKLHLWEGALALFWVTPLNSLQGLLPVLIFDSNVNMNTFAPLLNLFYYTPGIICAIDSDWIRHRN